MMNLSNRKNILITLASATAVVCLTVLLFFRTSLFLGILKKAGTVLMPFIYGAVIAYLLRPACVFFEKLLTGWFDKKGSGRHSSAIRMGSILLSLVVLLAALVLLLLAVVPELINSVSGLVRQLPQAVEQFEEWLASLDKGEISHEVVSSIQSSLNTLTDWLSDFLQTDVLPQLQTMVTGVTSSFMGILSVVKNFGLGCIISAYLLGSWEKYVFQCKMIIYAVFPKKTADWIKKEVRFTDEKFSGFINGKLLDSLIIGILCFLFVSIVGMPYAMLVSIIVGVTNIIPFFGPYLGAIPSAILILTVSPAKFLVFVIFIIVLQQLDGNVIGPSILGDKLGLSGFWILFSILVFGAVWGVMGMLVGAPIFAVLYDLVTGLVTDHLKKREQAEMLQEYEQQFCREKEKEKKAGLSFKKK